MRRFEVAIKLRQKLLDNMNIELEVFILWVNIQSYTVRHSSWQWDMEWLADGKKVVRNSS